MKLCLIVASIALLFVSHVMSAFAQGEDKQAALLHCEKVMAYVAVETGQDFGQTPCENNTYPKAFWECVEQRVVDGSAFHLSVQRCESRMGFSN